MKVGMAQQKKLGMDLFLTKVGKYNMGGDAS